MTDHFDWDRLARYVSGESGATERADIERWAASSETNRAMLESLKRRWNVASDGVAWNVDAAWARLAPQLRNVKADPAVVDIRSRSTPRFSWTRITRLVPLAAAAVLLVAVAVRMRTSNTETVGSPVALTASEMRTGPGEQRTLDLSDGSTVILGAASTLRIAEGFGASTREVSLEGQAFLRVVHDSTRPFVVNAGGTRTTDLGTAFEVRAYPNEAVRVAVTEGMVEVRRDSGMMGDSAVLQPGDVADVPTTGAIVKSQQNVERLLGWTRGELVFDDTPLSDAARDLERWFDIEVRFEDPALRSLRWNAKPRITDPLDTILELIETTFQSERVRAARNGNVITIRRGPPVNPTANPSKARNRVEAGA
jgi:ferric-dicitrate binding protein FerR (iron transport regulator)